MKLRTIFLLFITLLLLDRVYAATDTLHVKDILAEDLSVEEYISITLQNSSGIILSLPIDAIKILLDGATVNSTIHLPACGACVHEIRYSLASAARKTATYSYQFTRTVSFPESPGVLTYDIVLPIGYVLKTDSNPIVPRASAISTNGQNIIITWEFTNPSLPMAFAFDYFDHESVESTNSEIINELSETYVILFIILALLIGGAISYGVVQLWHKKNPRMFIPTSVLTPDEQEVMRVIKEGIVSQKEIGKHLNWSKSKVSAVVSNLAYKKLVSREKHGRNYTLAILQDVKK